MLRINRYIRPNIPIIIDYVYMKNVTLFSNFGQISKYKTKMFVSNLFVIKHFDVRSIEEDEQYEHSVASSV